MSKSLIHCTQQEATLTKKQRKKQKKKGGETAVGDISGMAPVSAESLLSSNLQRYVLFSWMWFMAKNGICINHPLIVNIRYRHLHISRL